MKPAIILYILLLSIPCLGQDDLLEQLGSDEQDGDYTIATFKSQRLVNGQTIETVPGGDLQFIFAHRFGRINSGLYDFFGLDQAFVRVGLEYGITDRLGVAIGRTSVDKTIDSYLRYKVLRQKTGASPMPVTLTLFGGAAVKVSPRNKDVPGTISFNDRMAYTTQALVARKFTSAVSLQVMPTLVHKNSVEGIGDNTITLLGVGGRLKITPSVAVTTEYYYRFNVPSGSPYHNPFGFGIDIETGGHVFQLVFTNTQHLSERGFLTETLGDFFDGDIHFGFNVTRMFSFNNRYAK